MKHKLTKGYRNSCNNNNKNELTKSNHSNSLTQSNLLSSPPYLIGAEGARKSKVNCRNSCNSDFPSTDFTSSPLLNRGRENLKKIEKSKVNSMSTVLPLNKILLTIFLTIFLLSSISALGVTPARNTMDFEPNKQSEAYFKIINSEGIDRELVIQTRGELGNNIVLQERRVTFTSSDKEKTINYKINLPTELSPGVHIGEIVISEQTQSSKDDNTVVGATLSVVTQVYVYVPYPGKYAEAKFNIKSGKLDEGTIFTISIMNKGKFNIENAYANIDIYSSLNEKIDSFNTKSVSITSGEKVDIPSNWKKEVPIGDYKAIATLIYDGETITLEDTFKIGSEILELQQITVNNFKLGDIAKMELLIENKWSEIIDKVYTQVQIFSNTGDILADFISPDYSIEPLKKEVLVSYWDTAGVQENTYDAKVTVHYSGDKSVDSDLQLVVSDDKIEVIGLGYVISGGGLEESSSLIMILVIVIGILILINVLWFLVLRKYIKKKQ